jgi:hypothetical protein
VIVGRVVGSGGRERGRVRKRRDRGGGSWVRGARERFGGRKAVVVERRKAVVVLVAVICRHYRERVRGPAAELPRFENSRNVEMTFSQLAGINQLCLLE